MKGLGWARVASTIALIGFVLPWAMVSCSGQKLATLSGFQLAIGDYSIRNPVTGVLERQQGSLDLWIAAAVIVIALGLVLGLLGSGAEARQTSLWSSLAGLLLSALGMSAVFSGRQAGIAKAQAQGQFDTAMAGLVQVHVEYGFWVTVIGLGAAAALCMMEHPATAEARPPAPAGPEPSDPDLAFWDGLEDRFDRDRLREYLSKFPSGRFVELAESRLAPGAAEPEPACPACGAANRPGHAFCTACGARREAALS